MGKVQHSNELPLWVQQLLLAMLEPQGLALTGRTLEQLCPNTVTDELDGGGW